MLRVHTSPMGGPFVWLLFHGLTACSVYDADLIPKIEQSPHSVTAAVDAGSTSSVLDAGGALPDSGPVIGPDDPIPRPDASANVTRCGDGQVTGDEKCDTAIESGGGACPKDCAPLANCVPQVLSGTGCNAECVLRPLTCTSGDGCCPPGCSAMNDNDCSAKCGDKVIQTDMGETCEPGTSTPCKTSDADCNDNDPCTTDRLVGSADNCNSSCTHDPITMLKPGDGCCPPGANANTDSDCQPKCGNGVVETGEQCDGGDTCSGMCKLILPADETRCLQSAKDACEQCACMKCAGTELACRASGDATSDSLCSDVLTCSRKANCLGFDCYCTNLCLSNGPCRSQIETAAGSTDINVVNMEFNDSTSALSHAYAADQCRTMQCADVCR